LKNNSIELIALKEKKPGKQAFSIEKIIVGAQKRRIFMSNFSFGRIFDIFVPSFNKE